MNRHLENLYTFLVYFYIYILSNMPKAPWNPPSQNKEELQQV